MLIPTMPSGKAMALAVSDGIRPCKVFDTWLMLYALQ